MVQWTEKFRQVYNIDNIIYIYIYIYIYLIFCWPCISIYLFLNSNQLDALNFIISFFQASTYFEHMCLSSGGQNCIILSLVLSHLCDDTRDFIIQFYPPDDEHMCSKQVEAWNKLIIKFSASSWLLLRNKKYNICCVIDWINYFIIVNTKEWLLSKKKR